MLSLFKIIANAQPEDNSAYEFSLDSYLDPLFILVLTAGLCIFVAWLFWHGGFAALKKAPTRRIRWNFFLWPLIILFIWQLSAMILLKSIAQLKGLEIRSLPESITYPVNAVVEIALIVIMLIVAHKSFARSLKGFGLNRRTIPKDICFSIIHLLSVLPFIYFALFLVLFCGRLLNGDFEVQKHDTLTFLSENGSIMRRGMIVLTALLIVPVFEEMLFRGFLQSTIRSSTSPWIAIIATSTFFTLIHYPNYTHMPSLFFLSCGLGYAYERSGSLLRPILMHLIFNGISVVSTLIQ
jgi:membrane protease YdiL (CAAX protease family)